MKKIIAHFLTLCLLASSMGGLVFAASDNDGLSRAIAAAKSKFTVEDSFNQFHYGVSERENETIWQLSWSREDGSSISMSVDAAGRLRSYYRYEERQDSSGKVVAPEITKAQALELAKACIAKTVPETSGHLKAKNTGSASPYSGVYSFEFFRVENGIPLYSDTVKAQVNYATKQVTSLSVSWNYDLTFPSVQGAISAQDAQAKLKSAMTARLEYRLNESTQAKQTVQAYLVYYSPDAYKTVDPFTGEIYTQNYGWEERDDENKSASQDAAMGGETGAEATGFSEEELAKIAELEKLLKAEQVDALLRGNPYLKLPDSYTLSSKALTTSHDDAGAYVWNLRYTGPVTKEKWDAPSANASVDARTGEILTFYTYNGEAAAKANFDEAAANKTAQSFLFKNASDKFQQTEKDTDNRIFYIENDEKNDPYAYGVRYTRVNEGVRFENDYLYVTVDAQDGLISAYHSNWHTDIAFESPAGVITDAQAIDQMIAQCAFSMQYELFTTYYYDQDVTQAPKEKSNVSILPYPGGEIPSTPSIRLVYTLDYSRPLTVAAKSGVLLGYDGQPYKESAADISYSDLSGHWVKTQAQLMADIGIGFDAGVLSPEKVVTQKEFLFLLLKTLSWYSPYDSISALAKSDTDDLYKQLEELGIIEKAEIKPDAAMTKLEAIRFTIRAAGYGKAAKIPGIYKTPFADDSAIAQADRGYCALAYGLGIVSGNDSGKLEPQKALSRAQTLAVLYKFIKS